MKRRIVITGLGTVNPLGNSVGESWERLLRGESGIVLAEGFDLTGYASKVLGKVKNFDYRKYYKPEFIGRAKRLDSFIHYAQAALKEALEQAGVETLENRKRVGICLGTGIGGMNINREQTKIFHQKGHRRISPFYIPTLIGNMASGFLAIEHGFEGPNLSVQTACASANHALGVALLLLQSGAADVMISGGSEGIAEQMTLAGFCNMKALSTRYNDDPVRASRPFDVDRDGFVLAEGAGVLILEEYEHAKRRGAKVLVEIKSVGMSSDAFDIVAPPKDGGGGLLAMQEALRIADVSPGMVNYINCHGTSTLIGDIAEARAILSLFGDRKRDFKIGSNKGMTGHMIGATAGVEAIFTVKTMLESKIPPNVNLFNLDPETGLDGGIVNREMEEAEVKVALSNSFGFGGHNSTVVFQKV